MFIFEPSRDSFYAFIDSVINKAHKDISKVTVLSSNEAFKEYMVARSDDAKDTEEESNIFSKITAHNDYDKLKRDIRDITYDSFVELETFKAENYNNWLTIINELDTLDVDMYRDKECDITDA